MRNYEETAIASVEELIVEVPVCRGPLQNNYYRGHADAAWGLHPSLFRLNLEQSPSDSWLEIANSSSLKFKQMVTPSIRREMTSELEWQAAACHHLAPTHLTSWSTAALVGLYFATEETSDRADGALWRLMPGDDRMTITQDYEQVPDAARIYHPQYQTAEMTAQRVCFLTHPFPDADSPPISFESYYNASDEPMNLCKILVPHEAKRDIRRQIAALGFDTRTVFPDLKGIGMQLAEDLQLHTPSYDWIM